MPKQRKAAPNSRWALLLLAGDGIMSSKLPVSRQMTMAIKQKIAAGV